MENVAMIKSILVLVVVVLFSMQQTLMLGNNMEHVADQDHIPATDTILVCGDSVVLMVDLLNSDDRNPKIIWRWNAKTAMDLPPIYRETKFNSVDDCKSVENGETILVSSSSGGVAVIDRNSQKVQFYTEVANAHSIELLPNNRLVVAASTAETGNKIVVFDLKNGGVQIYNDTLYSAHGVVWDEPKSSLFALGYDVLREYKLDDQAILKKINEWPIPGESGHDLQMASDGNTLLLTEHSGAWSFDLKEQEFKEFNLPHKQDIKSLAQNHSGQMMYVVAEESWWAFHVRFVDPPYILDFPNIRLYKARWFTRD